MVPSELLTEMNDKLAQAVKLYDHILTQQVSRPIWRQQTASPPAQPFNQWNYVRSPTSTQPTHTPMAEPLHQPSSTYTSPQAYQPPASDGPSHIRLHRHGPSPPTYLLLPALLPSMRLKRTHSTTWFTSTSNTNMHTQFNWYQSSSLTHQYMRLLK
ncbi:hypothetical protein F5888DRAFT_1808914 [Russula emetica]|nr:hypothetical protein F5888DRAFT_1808914 [Russula emetica]